jgi:hypothetical protein
MSATNKNQGGKVDSAKEPSTKHVQIREDDHEMEDENKKNLGKSVAKTGSGHKHKVLKLYIIYQ